MRHDAIAIETSLAVTARPLELAVIIPTFNELANVEPLLTRLSFALAGLHWEAIFVDDHSPDGTAAHVREIGRTNSQVRIVERIGRAADGLAAAAPAP